MTLAEGCLVHKNVSYERLSLVIPLTMADSVLYPETSRLYIWQITARKSPAEGMFSHSFATSSAIYKRDTHLISCGGGFLLGR